MCCFNGENHLEQAIKSVIAQSFKDWELIFWDNCSTDDSAKIAKSFKDNRIKYHRAPFHTDLGSARATSWTLLNGKFIAFLDADDTWEPTKLAKQLPLFDNPRNVIVAGNVMWFNETHKELIYQNSMPPDGSVTGKLLSNYFLSLPSVMLRKSAVDNLPYAFDKNYSHIADFDLFLRTSAMGEIKVLTSHVGNWRVHKGSQSWASRNQFYDEHLRWINDHKSADWLRPYKKEFCLFMVSTILKKFYLI